MKTIFFLFRDLITGIKRATIKQLDKVTACLVLIYSIAARMIGKQTAAAALPNMQKQQPYNNLQLFVPIQKDQQNNPRAEWKIWCENNRMLFQSSA
jgi:hypothetical protein